MYRTLVYSGVRACRETFYATSVLGSYVLALTSTYLMHFISEIQDNSAAHLLQKRYCTQIWKKIYLYPREFLNKIIWHILKSWDTVDMVHTFALHLILLLVLLWCRDCTVKAVNQQATKIKSHSLRKKNIFIISGISFCPLQYSAEGERPEPRQI